MDNQILKKKLSTFRTEKGSLIGVTSEVLFEVLRAWETWPSTSKEFYSSIGVSQRQMAVLLGKAKKMQREGEFPAEDFKEISVQTLGVPSSGPAAIEVTWDNGKVIRFATVDLLIDFLKRST